MLPRTKPRPLRVRRLPVGSRNTQTHTPPHTCFCTHCPLLETCLGIPRITTPYRLKIVGNHCLHAVAHPVGNDSTRKIISVYLTGLSVRGQNIPWEKKKSKACVKIKFFCCTLASCDFEIRWAAIKLSWWYKLLCYNSCWLKLRFTECCYSAQQR